jgi:hypothetical protein
LTPNTALKREIGKVRKLGYAVDDEAAVMIRRSVQPRAAVQTAIPTSDKESR